MEEVGLPEINWWVIWADCVDSGGVWGMKNIGTNKFALDNGFFFRTMRFSREKCVFFKPLESETLQSLQNRLPNDAQEMG